MALIDKASLLFVPSVVAQEKAFNILPSGNRAPDETGSHSGYDQTRADFSFDRGSNAAATRVNADGLIEKYRENLFTQSNNFGHSDWNVKTGTFTQGVEDPDGGNNAWSWTATNTDPYLYQSGKSTTGVSTLSIWVKGVGSTIGASFQIRTGAAPYKNLTLTGEWQRVEHFNTNISGTSVGFEYGNPAVVGDVVHIYQAQYEVGTIATDYLDSTSVTAKAGVLVDLPRINYDANGENGALLLEPSRQQLIQYSEYFGTWTLNSNGTGSDPVLDFGYTSPEGKDNAYKVTLDSGSGTTTSDESIMYLNKSGLTAGSEHTASVYLKGAVGGEEVIVRDTEGSYKKWTLTTEWARYEYTQTAAGSSYATSFGIRQGLGGIGTINSSAVVYIYGFQSELGSYKTSYIPNHGTSGGVTRAADGMQILNTDTANITSGTLFMELDGRSIADAGFRFQLATIGSETSNRLFISYQFEGKARMYSIKSGALQADNTSSTIVSSGNVKIAARFDANDMKLYMNGSVVGTDTNCQVPTGLNKIAIGRISDGQIQTRGILKQAILFDEALSDSELATLTTL